MTTYPDLTNIPSALRSRPQWVVWKLEPRETGGKPTKVPYQARHPKRKASSKAPHTWASVEEALKTAKRENFDGIGFVFSSDDPFAGFDLDDILDDKGRIAKWAETWLKDLPTYVEVSPSGHGLKGIAIGKLPGAGINAGSVELYDQGRYFAITGQRYDGFPEEPQPVNGALDRLYAFAVVRKAQLDEDRERYRQEAYAAAALRGEVARMESATEGTRNDALNRSAFALAQFIEGRLLTEDQIVSALTPAASKVGLTAAEIRGTLRSGIRAGTNEPRRIPPAVDTFTGEIVEAATAPLAKTAERLNPLNPTRAPDLLARNIPPPRQFVPGIIREGLSFFIGQPGVGKTPALVQLAIALATGTPWLGVFEVPKVRVAYIGPEYDEGDIRNIIMESTGGLVNLDNLIIFTVENFVGPSSEEEAMAMVDELVYIHRVEAIIIDLFTGFLPPEKFKQNAYRGDYREFLAYHRAALSHHILFTGAWHGTKRDANPATMYNGGQGFWGAAGGGRLVMYQDEEDQVRLYAQLRGNKPATYTMTESRNNGKRLWLVLEGADPEPAFGSDVHRAIYRTIKEHATSQGLTPKTIAGLVKPELAMNVSEAYIRKCISVLTRRGVLTAYGEGYVLAGEVRTGSRGIRGTEGTLGTEGTEGTRGTEGYRSVPSVPSDAKEGYGETEQYNASNEGSDPPYPPYPHFSTPLSTVPPDFTPSQASQEMIERFKARKNE